MVMGWSPWGGGAVASLRWRVVAFDFHPGILLSERLRLRDLPSGPSYQNDSSSRVVVLSPLCSRESSHLLGLPGSIAGLGLEHFPH